MNREPGRFWFFGIRCGCGSFPSWAIPFWRMTHPGSPGVVPNKILMPKRYCHQQNLGIISCFFFPTEIPPVTKTTCGDNEGNLPTLKTTKKIRKPARASRTFSHIRKELLLHLHQPSPSRSFEKMTSYVYTVSMNDLKIFHGWLGLFHPRKERSCRLLDRLSGETHQIISFFGGIFDQRWWTTTLLPRKCRISHDIHMPLDD